MNIGLLISGNLTGFGRFYTSPAAADLLEGEKISLDNHNYLAFLNNDEKAYSITFAKNFIAISQYSQILDSFRRPGKLVVTLLLPRNYTIAPNFGSPKGATYSLLTKVSDRFFEKNFLDGMINQNPAVLGQDYYTEILEGYSLKPSDNRRINENPSPAKKAGYVRATETDMPSYLDTPYRKSYGEGGFNVIFFGANAPIGTPNSIDEEPEEVVLYRVRILNTGATLPNPVKLSAPVYKLQARPGEKQFADEGTYKLTNDYSESRQSTYQDVIDHLLEPRITGRIVPGEIIEIQYNFEKEEKTIKFVFTDMDTSQPVSFDKVLPSIVYTDGSRQPISSDTFTFHGPEIYADKKIIADNSELTISQRSEKLDLSRLNDGQEYKVFVQQGFNLPIAPWLTNIPVSFINKKTGQRLFAENQNSIHLPGSVNDWCYSINTDKYYAEEQPLIIQNGIWIIKNPQRETATGGNSSRFSSKPYNSTVAVQTNKPIFVETSSTGETKNKEKIKWHKYLLLLPLLPVIAGIVWWIRSGNDDPQQTAETETKSYVYGKYIYYVDDITQSEDNIEKLYKSIREYFCFRFYKTDGKELDASQIKEDWRNDCLYQKFVLDTVLYKGIEEIMVEVNFVDKTFGKEYNITKQKIDLKKVEIESNLDTIRINLGVRFSWIKLYDKIDLKHEDIQEKINEIEQNYKNKEKCQYIKELLDKLNEVLRNQSFGRNEDKKVNYEQLSKASCNITNNNLFKFKEKDKKLEDGKTTVQQRVKNLQEVYVCLNGNYKGMEGKVVPPRVDSLSKEQSDLINEVFTKTSKDLRQNKFEEKKPKFTSIKQFYDFYKSEIEF